MERFNSFYIQWMDDFCVDIQITENAARIQVNSGGSAKICIFDLNLDMIIMMKKIRCGVTVIKSGGTLSYSFFMMIKP